MSQENTYYNRKYKDSLFRFIFNNKEAALSLYNAINDSDYQETDAMEFYTMNDFLYMGMKNDLSFLLDWNLTMFEYQCRTQRSNHGTLPAAPSVFIIRGCASKKDF